MNKPALGIAAAAVLIAGTCLVQAAPGNTAATGSDNQAVATTSANAPRPAHGSNSFTMAQARTRIEKDGYQDVTGLHKTANGVWQGKAQKGGASTMVWLDYKGNVGQSQ